MAHTEKYYSTAKKSDYSVYFILNNRVILKWNKT